MNYQLDETWAQRLKQMWKWMRGFRVEGAASFKNTAESCTISLAPPMPANSMAVNWPIMAVITSYANGTVGANWKQIDPQSGSNAARFKDNGFTDELLGPAFHATGQTRGISGDGTTNGTAVWLWLRPDSNGSNVPVFVSAGGDSGPFLARLTSSNGAFIEVSYSVSGSNFSAVAGGVTASASVEVNGAKGWLAGTSSGTIVWMKQVGTTYVFEYSVRVGHNNAHVGYTSLLQVDSARGSHNLMEISMLAGTNGAGLHFKSSGSAYQVFQNDSANNNVVVDDVHART